MKHTTRDHLKGLAEQASKLAHARRPRVKEGSANLAANARAAHAIWTLVLADYERRAPWLEDRVQLSELLGLAHGSARAAGFHTASPESLADWLIEDLRKAAESSDRCPNGNVAPECTEIDPCEPCMQDHDAEGDMIERSMGLR